MLALADKSGKVQATVNELEEQLEKAGVEVLLDDRNERPGVKFNDADLIGIPYQIVIGEKGLAQGQVELKERRTGTVTKLAPHEIVPRLKELLAQYGLFSRWQE
jgi:prolyl-tRNA synthetase